MVDSVTNLGSSAANAAQEKFNSTKTQETKTDGEKVKDDYDKFLLLMTTQMRNQDPLKPLDSTQFVSQLAQFSGVEQQIKMNDKLDSMLSSFSNQQIDQAANLLNKTIATQNGVVEYNGDPINFEYSSDATADKVAALVKDANGIVVQTIPLGLSSTPKQAKWDGTTINSDSAIKGKYTISIANYKDGEIENQQKAIVENTVSEIIKDNNNIYLKLNTGEKIAINDVKSIK